MSRNNPLPLWLHIPLVLGLGLASWISGMDTTGAPGDTVILWTGTALLTGLLALRLLAGAR